MTPEMQMELIAALEDAAAAAAVYSFSPARATHFAQASIFPRCRDACRENPQRTSRGCGAHRSPLSHPLRTADSHHRRGPRPGNRRRNGLGNHLRLHARHAGQQSSDSPKCASALFPRWCRPFSRCKSATSAAAICCSPAASSMRKRPSPRTGE